MNQSHNQVKQIITDLGIGGKKAAEIIGISHSNYGNKMNDNIKEYFNEKHYKKLTHYLSEYICRINK